MKYNKFLTILLQADCWVSQSHVPTILKQITETIQGLTPNCRNMISKNIC